LLVKRRHVRGAAFDKQNALQVGEGTVRRSRLEVIECLFEEILRKIAKKRAKNLVVSEIIRTFAT